MDRDRHILADFIIASALYSRNIYDFAKLIISEEKTLVIPEDDDIEQATLVIKEGEVWKP